MDLPQGGSQIGFLEGSAIRHSCQTSDQKEDKQQR